MRRACSQAVGALKPFRHYQLEAELFASQGMAAQQERSIMFLSQHLRVTMASDEEYVSCYCAVAWLGN